MRKVLYLPIEESARELEARLILAHFALRDGWRVVVGHQMLLTKIIHEFPVGVYFAKGTNAIQCNKIRPLKARGFGIVSIEEENVPLAEPLLIKNLMARDVAEMTDVYLAHGAFDAEVVTEANPAIDGKVEIVGVGRFDLLKPLFLEQRREKAAELRAKYGDFVLLNTNFGYANTFVGSPEEFYRKLLVGMGIVDESDPEEVALWQRALEFETRTMEGFKQLARALADEVPVVLRPHTSENIDTWHALAAEREWAGRLSVVREGPVVDWIHASRLVVQNSCTTGLEAKVMGRPVISFTPFDNGMAACFVANRVLRRIESVPEIVDLARRVAGGQALDGQLATGGREPMNRYVRDADDELVSERQWRAIRRKFDGASQTATEQDFPGKKFALKGAHAHYRVKFSVTTQQFREAFVMVSRALRGTFPVTLRVAGEGLFELSRTQDGD
ncbi:surface carbohydrate biosynthesis protein [Nisaea sp.]|uniref:surface carbohydrate biosynthesis protein n=1 Tax=Nisaea sp. TaxID=2024842 RepID=UPI003B52FF13